MAPLQLSNAASQSFRPLTVERPKVLLPLIGVPLIEYTLEWLVSSGITEVRSPLRGVTACAYRGAASRLTRPARRLSFSAVRMRSKCRST